MAGRMPQSGKLPVLNFLTGATRSTDSRQTWRGRRAPGSAWLCKISCQLAQGVRMLPQNIKKFPLFVNSRLPRSEPVTDF